MRLVVTGSSGQVGREVVAQARARGWDVVGLARSEDPPCDVTDAAAVAERVRAARPDLVVHCAARTDVDGCELDPAGAMRTNVHGSRHVAEAAAAVGAHVVGLSTDYVFDGEKPGPYVEADRPRPLSVYGATKLAGEAVLGPTATVVRTSWVCGAHGASAARTVLALLAAGRPLRFVADQVGQPTIVADLVPRLLDLGRDRAAGVFHVANRGPMSRYDLARAVAEAAGHDPDLVEPIATADLEPPRAARRPRQVVLEGAALRRAGYEPMPPVRPSLDALVARLLAS